MSIADEVFQLFETRGDAAYFGEPVSQKEHALQAAFQAQKEGAPESLVVAALLHDVGHLLHGQPEDVADRGLDAHHEDVGHAWLAKYFGREVSEPVRMHVEAKRYLCRVDPTYLEQLSPASLQSLQLQGGPLDDEAVREFEGRRYYREAVRLRRWDDMAKVQGLPLPDLEHYRQMLQAQMIKASK